jgi:hypothetical protein
MSDDFDTRKPGESTSFVQEGYSTLFSNKPTPTFRGRPRISSESKRVQGGIFCPEILESRMEAIAVDYVKDDYLKTFLEGIDQKASVIYRSSKTDPVLSLLQYVSKTIPDRFPYQKKMVDDKNATTKYATTKYKPGYKYGLGVFMQEKDMVCRHMALLSAAAMDFFKDNYSESKGYTRLKPESLESRYMADLQTVKKDGQEKRDGHAYHIVRVVRDNGSYGALYVSEPTCGMVCDLSEILKECKNHKGRLYTFYVRYLFSALRILFQFKSPLDDFLLLKIFKECATDHALTKVIISLGGVLNMDVDQYQRYVKLSIQAKIQV